MNLERVTRSQIFLTGFGWRTVDFPLPRRTQGLLVFFMSLVSENRVTRVTRSLLKGPLGPDF